MAWEGYVDGFHAERPGITERILTRCRAGGLDPYDWLAEAVAEVDGPVVDVACGSAPTAGRWAGWVGVDPSAAELDAAARAGRGPLVRATAASLPVATGAAQALVCAMGLQVIELLGPSLQELTRTLRPGGRLAALVPASRPLPWRDALLYLRLQVALRARLTYPNDSDLRPAHLAEVATAAGLTVARDERRAFTLPLPDDGAVDDLLRSLYLPGVTPTRFEAGRRALRRRRGGTVAVPLRRLVLTRPAGVDR